MFLCYSDNICIEFHLAFFLFTVIEPADQTEHYSVGRHDGTSQLVFLPSFIVARQILFQGNVSNERSALYQRWREDLFFF